MSRTAAHVSVAIVSRRYVHISRDESRGESKCAYRFHHQQSEITATATFEIERLHRRLTSLRQTHGITKFSLDCLRHRRQHRESIRLAFGIDEAPNPQIDLMNLIWILPFDRAVQVRNVLG